MTSTDATNPGAGEPPERWSGSWPDGWSSPHSEPGEGQLELSLDEQQPPQEPPARSGPDGPEGHGHAAAAELPRQQSEAPLDGAPEGGRVPGRPEGPDGPGGPDAPCEPGGPAEAAEAAEAGGSGASDGVGGSVERGRQGAPDPREAVAVRAAQAQAVLAPEAAAAEHPPGHDCRDLPGDSGTAHRENEPQDAHAYAAAPDCGWDDGVIARRARAERAAPPAAQAEPPAPAAPAPPAPPAQQAQQGQATEPGRPVGGTDPAGAAEPTGRAAPAGAAEPSRPVARPEPSVPPGPPVRPERAVAPEAGPRAPNPRSHTSATETPARGAEHPRPGCAATPPWRGTSRPEPPRAPDPAPDPGAAPEPHPADAERAPTAAVPEPAPPAVPEPAPAQQVPEPAPAVRETPSSSAAQAPRAATEDVSARTHVRPEAPGPAPEERPHRQPLRPRPEPDGGTAAAAPRGGLEDSTRRVEGSCAQDLAGSALHDVGAGGSAARRSTDPAPVRNTRNEQHDRNEQRDRHDRKDVCRDLRRDIRRDPRCDAGESVLRQRLGALRELVGLSRTRLDADVLAEAGTVLDEAATRRGLPRSYTTVALAGATGSGKSSLFNALTGGRLSEVGMRRPTTAAPVACTWEAGRYSDGSPDGLLDRLGIPQHARHRTHDGTLSGLILVDLPDHDSAAPGHREQVDRMLELVDAVVWVVDPEKYADALLHEDYLRRLAGHAEVTFVVLNQTDRLTRDSVDAVLDDLRRLLDEDGMALGEHGEPGAAVLSASALTHEGIDVLREELGEFVAQQRAAVLRLTADLDGAMDRLRPVYTEPGAGAEGGPVGLSERAREDFEDRLAVAVGAAAAGQAAERAWLRQAEHSSGIPWVRALRWYASRPTSERGEWAGAETGERPDGSTAGARVRRDTLQQPLAARPVVAQAVRELADAAASGLPDAWAHTVRESARRGAAGLPEALDQVMEACSAGPDAERTAAITASLTDFPYGTETPRAAKPASATAAAVPGQQSAPGAPGPRAASDPGRPRGPQPGADGGADAPADGPDAGSGMRGATASPALDGAPRWTVAASDGPVRDLAGPSRDIAGPSPETGGSSPESVGSSPESVGSSPDADRTAGSGVRVPRPTWHTAAFAGQWLLFALQAAGAVWVAVVAIVAHGFDRTALLPCVLLAAATLAGPGLAWACRRAARGPARTYGLEEERRLRQLAACCGGTRVLEPVAAELLRYRQVREQYAIAAGAVDSVVEERPAEAWIGSQGAAIVGAQSGSAAGGSAGGVDGRGAGISAGGPRDPFKHGDRSAPGGCGGSGDSAASDTGERGAGVGAGTDTTGSSTGVTELCTTSE